MIIAVGANANDRREVQGMTIGASEAETFTAADTEDGPAPNRPRQLQKQILLQLIGDPRV